MIRRLLVANRGEIARRVFATCRAVGIETVAVYSDADADAPYVAEADYAVHLPGNAPDRDVPARRPAHRRRPDGPAPTPSTRATASWPRTPTSRAAVTDAGLIWVGPPAEGDRR